MSKYKSLCGLCLAVTKANEDVLKCEGCVAAMHRYCAGVTKQQYDQLIAKSQPFLCAVCTQSLLKTQVLALQTEVATLKSELAKLKEKTTTIQEPNQSLQTLKEDLELVKSKLERPSYATAVKRSAGYKKKSHNSATTNNAMGHNKPSHKEVQVRTKLAIPRKRKNWGTLKACSSSMVKHAISKFTTIEESDIVVKRKYLVNSNNRITRWWHVISSDEQTMHKLEEEWEKVKIQTSWNLTQCLSYANENEESTFIHETEVELHPIPNSSFGQQQTDSEVPLSN